MTRLVLLIRFIIFFFLLSPLITYSQNIQLQNVTIVTGSNSLSNGEKASVKILTEEVEKRTGLQWKVSSLMPDNGTVIVIKKSTDKLKNFTFNSSQALIQKPESFRLAVSNDKERTIIVVEGFDSRGEFFGVGKLLRLFEYNKGSVSLPVGISISSTPDKPIRGHQLGYRNTANSYDAWTPEQFEQYIRELAIFGTNSIETIPIFDEKGSPHFKISSDEMNKKISEICQQYDLDYWMWVPAQMDLNDKEKRNGYLSKFEKICSYSVRMNGVFFPGGDPGDNPPELVLPLLEDMSVILKKYHPKALIWLSLQNFNARQSQFVYKYIREKMPVWLGGLVTGPSSPPAAESRAELPAKYQLRQYPDLTHNVRCDSPVPWWDPAFNFTLGREAINPEPYYFAAVYHALDQYINGFISYSDGIHDDVNKIIWTTLSWNRNEDLREALKEYSNFFFGSSFKEEAADGILSLEKNWEGPIAANGSIQSTLVVWQMLEKMHPELSSNWRWQMYLLRANYDAYVRNRYMYETELEQKANSVLLAANTIGTAKAMEDAMAILNKAESERVTPELREKVFALCEALYQSIGLQTSVEKYKASGEERGAVLDFIDRPLNNRWWLEDEFKRIKTLPEKEQTAALKTIAEWEHPGEGSFYDNVGNVSKSPHQIRGQNWRVKPLNVEEDGPGFDWWENGFSRKRLSWMINMRWPLGIDYTGLDSTADYTVRITGYGECLLKINGQRVSPSRYGRGVGEIKEFPVPQSLIQQGHILLTWDDLNEDFLNWRQQSRINEVWLIKNNSIK
ncbi:MAG: hypothetical protein JST09_16975 [Bacteroidetes bacterium]|nr:hypothetical protein [Bacteroidota bacterium]